MKPDKLIKADDIRNLSGRGLKSSLGKTTIKSEIDNPWAGCDVESDSGYESLRAQAVSLNYTGKCVVRIKFYRRRLADYSRANCEKYLIDSLTYAGLIRDDSEKEIRLIDEGQEKVSTNEEERVEITLEYEEVDLDNLWTKKTQFGNSGPAKEQK
jgi:hypothetical protein